MILTEEQAKERLNSNRNLVSKFHIQDKPNNVTIIPIRRPGGEMTTIDVEKKVDIATRARFGEDQKTIAAEYGISQQTVSALNTGYRGSEVLGNKVEDRMAAVKDVALLKLMASLDLIDSGKLSGLGAKDLSLVAKNMSSVVGSFNEHKDSGAGVQVHIYAPELRQEKHYSVIEVGASA